MSTDDLQVGTSAPQAEVSRDPNAPFWASVVVESSSDRLKGAHEETLPNGTVVTHN